VGPDVRAGEGQMGELIERLVADVGGDRYSSLHANKIGE
jgi:hypothetical protein